MSEGGIMICEACAVWCSRERVTFYARREAFAHVALVHPARLIVWFARTDGEEPPDLHALLAARSDV